MECERGYMDNYYETCLKNIQDLLEKNAETKALALLDEELRLPYVPEPYFSKFKSIRDGIRIDQQPASKYFENLDEIDVALRSHEALQHKAMISLERVNLRSEIEWMRLWLKDPLIEDWIKKQLLFFSLSQEINAIFECSIQSEEHLINMSELENPYSSLTYTKTLKDLKDMLESKNPSMLILCEMELNQNIMDAFPFKLDNLDAKEIVRTVEGYLSIN